MTRRLEQALAAVAKLPPAEQDAIAEAILAEVGAEGAWDQRFAQSRPALERLAEEALDEHRRGKTEPLDPDAL